MKKGPSLLAHAASSLLQKSCFRKTPEAPKLRERDKNRPGVALTITAHSPNLPQAESAWHCGLPTYLDQQPACPPEASSKVLPQGQTEHRVQGRCWA